MAVYISAVTKAKPYTRCPMKTAQSVMKAVTDLDMTVLQKEVGSRPFDTGSTVHLLQAVHLAAAAARHEAVLGFFADCLQTTRLHS